MKTFTKRSLLLTALTLSVFSTACDEVSSALDDEIFLQEYRGGTISGDLGEVAIDQEGDAQVDVYDDGFNSSHVRSSTYVVTSTSQTI